MAPLPPMSPTNSATVRAIYAAYAANNDAWEGRSISISTLAEECGRKLWYDFRWASPAEQLDGRALRIFETGNREEDRWVENLRMIGCDVLDRDPDTGKQITVIACNGHVRGKLDVEVVGLPEAPKTVHVGEIKSHNAKSFAKLVKDGVKVSKPLHYGQLQTYMHLRSRDRGIYLAVCKDTDELYAERVHLDVECVIRLLARAQRIIDSSEPTPKMHEDPNSKMAFACGWCKHKSVCHEGAWPRVNCRTCLFSTPEVGGSWSCARFSKPLSADEQAVGCPAHLTLPGLIDGEQTDCDEDEGTVTYAMRDGTTWIDGASMEIEHVSAT